MLPFFPMHILEHHLITCISSKYFFPLHRCLSSESITSIQKQWEPPVGTSSEFWGQPTVFVWRTHLFLGASKAACFGEQVISPAWRSLRWQLKAELPLIRSSAQCLCHRWREYGHQHAVLHICKGNSKSNYTHSQHSCPCGWEQKWTNSTCFALSECISASHFLLSVWTSGSSIDKNTNSNGRSLHQWCWCLGKDLLSFQ